MPKVRANGIELYYESFGQGEPLVLIMGIGGQMILWDEDFCHALAAKGFRVIRFDNRDVGESTKVDELPTLPPNDVLKRKLLGRPIPGYTLDDMADDTAGLLDALELSSAHIVGMSFGGMVAQCMALKHPSRVRSLGLIMSNSGELWANLPRPEAFAALVSKVGKNREEAIARQVKLFRVVGRSPHRTPEARVAEIAGIHYDRGVFPRGFARQFQAMVASPGRLRALSELRVPTTVIHGASDPLVHPMGGRLLAAMIPESRLTLIRNMGHDLSPSVWPYVIRELTDNAYRVVSQTQGHVRPRWSALVDEPVEIAVAG